MDALLTLGLSVGIFCAVFVGARASAVGLRRADEEPDDRTRLVGQIVRLLCLGTVLVGAFAIYARYPIGSAVVAALGLGSDRPELAAVADAVAATGTALAGLVAVRRGQRPFRDWLQREPLTVDSAFRRRRWIADAAALSALALVAQCGQYGLLANGTGWLLAATPAVWAGRAALIEPLQAVSADAVRDPTDDERARIERCYERFGGAPGTIVVFAAEETETPLRVVGRGALESIWVRDTFLERATDDELAVGLAQADAAGVPTLPAYLRTVAGVFGSAIALGCYGTVVDGASGFVSIAIGVLALTLVLLIYYCVRWRRRLASADSLAADRLGPETVRSVYREIGTDLALIPEGRKDTVLPDRLDRLTNVEPSVAYRIERLEREYGLEPVPVPEPGPMPAESDAEIDETTATDRETDGDESRAPPTEAQPDPRVGDERTSEAVDSRTRTERVGSEPDAGSETETETESETDAASETDAVARTETDTAESWPPTESSVRRATDESDGDTDTEGADGDGWPTPPTDADPSAAGSESGTDWRTSGTDATATDADGTDEWGRPASDAGLATPDATNRGEGGGPSTAPRSYWRWGVLLSTVAWIAIFAIAGMDSQPASDVTLGFAIIGAWVGLPLSVYMDSRATERAADWPKYRKTVLLLSAVWLVNLLVGVWYFANRPPADPGAGSTASDGPTPTGTATVAETGTYSRKRLLAAGGLLVVGLLLTASFGLVMEDLMAMTGSGEVEVETFDPGTDPERATVAPEILSLEDEIADTDAPDDVERAIDEAAATGRYESDGDPPDGLEEIATATWWGEEPSYAVYEGEYYEWDGSVDADGTARIALEPTTNETVMDDVATPYATATELQRDAVDDARDADRSDGERTGDDADATDDAVGEADPEPGIVVDDGSYYAVSSPSHERIAENESRVAGRILLAGVTALLTPVGVAFTVVGGWLTKRLFRREPTTIDRATGLKLALVAVVAGGIVTATSSPFAIVQNALIAGGVVMLATVGHYRDRGRRRRMRNVLIGVPIVVSLGAVLSAGPFGLVFAGIGLLAAGVVGWPLILYGQRFSEPPASESSASSESDGDPAWPTDDGDWSASDDAETGGDWTTGDSSGDAETGSTDGWGSSDETDTESADDWVPSGDDDDDAERTW